MSYKEKYLKYKFKYFNLIQNGSAPQLKKYNAKLLELAKIAKGKRLDREKLFEENKCKLIYKYVNIDLGINIIITSKPVYDEKTYKVCFDLLIKENIILYITFNEEYLKEERDNFNKLCISKECKFVDIIIKDYTHPTAYELFLFWAYLDYFYTVTKIKNNKYNVLIHCAEGTGRSGFMLISYIWLKKIKIDPSFLELTLDLFPILIKTTEINSKENYDMIRSNKVFIFLGDELKKYSIKSYEEVFEEPHRQILFLNRILSLIYAYYYYYKIKFDEIYIPDYNESIIIIKSPITKIIKSPITEIIKPNPEENDLEGFYDD